MEKLAETLARAIDSGILARVQHLFPFDLPVGTVLSAKCDVSTQKTILAHAAELACKAATDDSSAFLILHWLLDQGVDEEKQALKEGIRVSRDFEQNTILHLAARYGSLDVAQLYLRYSPPAVLDFPNVARGETPLHLACKHGHAALVMYYIDMGADIDACDLKGDTPLHYASAWDRPAIIQLLIQAGCSHQAKNNAGWAALDVAYSFDIAASIQDCVRVMFEQQKRERAARKHNKSRERAQRVDGGSDPAGDVKRRSLEQVSAPPRSQSAFAMTRSASANALPDPFVQATSIHNPDMSRLAPSEVPSRQREVPLMLAMSEREESNTQYAESRSRSNTDPTTPSANTIRPGSRSASLSNASEQVLEAQDLPSTSPNDLAPIALPPSLRMGAHE